MLLAHKMDNVVKDSVHMDVAKLVFRKVNQEHSVIDTKIAQEKGKMHVVSGIKHCKLYGFCI